MPKKIILDCDPGHDDAVAIMLAVASDEIDLLGITCVGGNATLENTKLNTLKICSLLNRKDILIYSGASKPLVYDLVTAEHVHGKSGLDNDGEEIKVDEDHFIQELNAVDYIIKTCKTSEEKIYLCPTGPLTNIALSLKKDPSIKENIKEIVFMGGAALSLGNITPAAEFNIYVDPHAANIVLKSGIPITMMGLDVTHKVNVNKRIIQSIKSNNNKASMFFADLMEFYSKFNNELYDTDESPLHDPCVIAYLIDNKLFYGKKVHVEVEENSELTRGDTVTDWWGVKKLEPNCNVIVEANSEKFFEILKLELAKLN
jgi:purine nucleosidase|tara:strand:+ start:459 stop:1403 length:945 start_codon:yes stop_codon:yes gene_type:complete